MRYSSYIIHDLRNPLHLAMAALAMVEEEPDYRPQSDLARFLTMAQGGLRRMFNLVDALLDIGRMETGQTLRRAAMDVRDLVERCVKGSQPLALIGNLTLRSAFPDGHGMPSICADATRLERVIMNLIDNAVRHTPADGEVVVSLGGTHERFGWRWTTRARAFPQASGSGFLPGLCRLKGRRDRTALGWAWPIAGAGIGSAMAANKVPNVLAAACYNETLARNSREHNGANVLTLGSGRSRRTRRS